MKVLFAIGNAAVSEEVKKQYYALYDEKIESKDVFYFKAILEEVKRDKSYDRIVIAEQLEPMQNNVVSANDQVIFNNIDSITDEIEDSAIIFICADNRTKSDNLIGRLFNIGIYNVLMGDERQPKQLCSLIREPRNKKEAKEYLRNNPAIKGESVATPDEGVDERELLNIVNYFDKLRTPEEYLKSFGDVVDQQYSDEDLTIIVATLTTKLSRGSEIFETLSSDARYSKYCKWNNKGVVQPDKGKSGILGFLKNNKKMLINDFGNMKEKIINRKKSDVPKDEEPIKEDKSSSISNVGAAIGGVFSGNLNTGSTQPLNNSAMTSSQNTNIEEQIKSLQDAQNRLLEEQRKQNEELLRKQQEDINEKMRQEALLRQQQEAYAKQQREMLLKQQQEAYAKQQEELVRKQQEELARQQQEVLAKKQQEELARQQQEAYAKKQQEELARQQQEVLAKRQQEELARKQQEELARKQQEEIARQQQEAFARKQQEALLKQQQEAMYRQQQEELARQQQEALFKQQQESMNPIKDDKSDYSVIGAAIGGVVEGVKNVVHSNETTNPQPNVEVDRTKANQDSLAKAQHQSIFYAQKEAEYRGAQAEAERKAEEEKAKKANEEMARRLQAESAMRATQEAQRKAQEEQVRKAQEDARMQAQKEAEAIRRAQEAAINNQSNVALAKAEAELKAKYQAQEAELNRQRELLRQQQEELRQQQEAFQSQQNSFAASMNNMPPMGHPFANQNDFADGPDTFAQGLPSFSSLNISRDYRKVIAFVGTNKVGTSFIVNSVATLLAQKGVKTSILDMTKTRGLYWFYWKDALKQMDIVQNCMSNASNGNPEPIQVGGTRNLTLYTTIPKGSEDNRKNYRHRNVVDSARRNCNVLLIDCDFTTPFDYFEQADELYVVQDLDFIKVQETADFFKNLKAKQFDWNKIKLIINNKIRCSVSTKKIVKNGLKYYDDPNMTYTEEFEEIKTFVEFPMEQDNYANYLDSMDNGKLNVEKYTPSMKKSLSDLVNLIYGMNANKRGIFG